MCHNNQLYNNLAELCYVPYVSYCTQNDVMSLGVNCGSGWSLKTQPILLVFQMFPWFEGPLLGSPLYTLLTGSYQNKQTSLISSKLSWSVSCFFFSSEFSKICLFIRSVFDFNKSSKASLFSLQRFISSCNQDSLATCNHKNVMEREWSKTQMCLNVCFQFCKDNNNNN